VRLKGREHVSGSDVDRLRRRDKSATLVIPAARDCGERFEEAR